MQLYMCFNFLGLWFTSHWDLAKFGRLAVSVSSTYLHLVLVILCMYTPIKRKACSVLWLAAFLKDSLHGSSQLLCSTQTTQNTPDGTWQSRQRCFTAVSVVIQLEDAQAAQLDHWVLLQFLWAELWLNANHTFGWLQSKVQHSPGFGLEPPCACIWVLEQG